MSVSSCSFQRVNLCGRGFLCLDPQTQLQGLLMGSGVWGPKSAILPKAQRKHSLLFTGFSWGFSLGGGKCEGLLLFYVSTLYGVGV